MGAAGARPKRGGGGDSVDEGSVETIYSEDDRSLDSNGPGGEGKQHSPQAAAAAPARAMQRRDQMRQQIQADEFAQQQQMQGQVAPPVTTSADRAYAAAQAQVEAHKKQSASSQQPQQGMVKGAGKMRARPRIRSLGGLGLQPVNPNPNMSSSGDKEGDAKRDMDQDIDAYQNIISQGSVSRVQQRAEGAGASLDRVRGPSTGQGQNMNVSPQQSGLGGMNRPNQPMRTRPQQNGAPRMRKNPTMSPDAAGPFPNVASPTKQDAMNGLKKIYRPNN